MIEALFTAAISLGVYRVCVQEGGREVCSSVVGQ